MGVTDPREQDPEVVVDLRDGPHRRAWVPRGRLLIDLDGRAQALDEVDVRLLHLPEELPRVGAEGLDVTPLALGVDRVERERRLAGSGQSGEDDEGVPRKLQRDVAEVVLPGAMDDEGVLGHVDRVYRRLRTPRRDDRVGLRGMARELQGPVAPSFGEAFRFWLKLGFVNFGGPTGQIAVMHEELVDRRGGLAAAVVGIVAAAMLSIGGRALRGRVAVAVAGLAFLAIFIVGVPFPLVVL